MYPARRITSKPVTNRILNWIVAATIALQIGTITIPGLRTVLGLEPLDPTALALVATRTDGLGDRRQPHCPLRHRNRVTGSFRTPERRAVVRIEPTLHDGSAMHAAALSLSSNARTWNVSVALLSLEDDRVWSDLRRCHRCNLSPTATRPLPA